MKRVLFLACALGILLPIPVRADDRDGLRVSVTKTVLDRESTRLGLHRRHEVTLKETGLRVRLQNLRLEELPESKLHYTLQLDRGGPPRGLWARDTQHSGTVTLPALKPSASTELVVGPVRLRSTNFAEDDEITGWRVVIEVPDGRTVTFQSPGFKERS